MKTLAALLAVVLMSGCVIHWPPGRTDADERMRGARTVVVCIFASCKDVVRPPETESQPK